MTQKWISESQRVGKPAIFRITNRFPPPTHYHPISLFQFLRISSSIKRKDLGDWD